MLEPGQKRLYWIILIACIIFFIMDIRDHRWSGIILDVMIGIISAWVLRLHYKENQNV